jgi:hypothetical protein
LNHVEDLIEVIKETRTYLALDGNDYSWSSWNDKDQALAEIDAILAQLEDGSVPEMEILFAPTGPIQEVSLSSGWTREFLKLAERFDVAYAKAKNQL